MRFPCDIAAPGPYLHPCAFEVTLFAGLGRNFGGRFRAISGKLDWGRLDIRPARTPATSPPLAPLTKATLGGWTGSGPPLARRMLLGLPGVIALKDRLGVEGGDFFSANRVPLHSLPEGGVK